MNQLFTFLSRYQRRDQIMLLVGALSVVIYLLWMLVLAPIQNKRDRLLQTNVAATQSLGRVQIMVAQIQQYRAQGAQATNGGEIMGIVDAGIRGNGLTVSGLTPMSEGGVRVRFERAAYEPLMQWLYEVEFKNGLSVGDMTIAATNDPGLVTVNMRIQKAN